MSIEPISCYDGPDGDKWDLGRDLDTGRLYVLHRPSPASGAAMVDYELVAFLDRYRGTPQHDELMRQASMAGYEVERA